MVDRSSPLPEVRVAVPSALSQASTWSRVADKTYLTFVVKASFALTSSDAPALLAPTSVATRDVHLGGDAKRALVVANEAAPYLTQAAVIVTGLAHPVSSRPTEPFTVRLALARQRASIDKSIRVVSKNGRPVELAWTRARLTPDNPHGSTEPSISDPRDAELAASLAPISPSMRERAQFLRGAAPRLDVEVLELGRELDSRFWNPAPADQQTSFLSGGEVLLVEGLDRDERRMQIRLPSLAVIATCDVDGAGARPMSMSADMLVVDGDNGTVSVVWRAITPIADGVRTVKLRADLPGIETTKSRGGPRTLPPAAPTPEPPKLLSGKALLLDRIARGALLDDLDLRKLDLGDLDVSGRSFTGACLDGASLVGARLVKAHFVRSTFVGADLSGAVVDGAIFDDCDFTGATLDRASFKKSVFERVNLSSISAERASFDGARLTGAKLDGASFSRASLIETTLDRSVGTGTSFVLACAVKATFIEARLAGASFEKASIDEARFDDADLSKANLLQVAGPAARFAGSRLDGAVLRQGQLEGAAFSKATLVGADLGRADLNRALFDGARLDRADLRGANLEHAYFNDASLDATDLREADLTGATMTGANRATALWAGAKLKDIVD